MTDLAILDTSVFIAQEAGRELTRALPVEIGVSVITLAELELGVLVAGDPATRSQRLTTLTRIREQTAGIPIDDRTASVYARLAAQQLAEGRRPRVHDTWIAATALVHGAAVWTQDADFSVMPDVEVVRL